MNLLGLLTKSKRTWCTVLVFHYRKLVCPIRSLTCVIWWRSFLFHFITEPRKVLWPLWRLCALCVRKIPPQRIWGYSSFKLDVYSIVVIIKYLWSNMKDQRPIIIKCHKRGVCNELKILSAVSEIFSWNLEILNSETLL